MVMVVMWWCGYGSVGVVMVCYGGGMVIVVM